MAANVDIIDIDSNVLRDPQGGSSICNMLLLDHSVNEPITSSELCCFTGILIMLINNLLMSFDVRYMFCVIRFASWKFAITKKMGFPGFECDYPAYQNRTSFEKFRTKTLLTNSNTVHKSNIFVINSLNKLTLAPHQFSNTENVSTCV